MEESLNRKDSDVSAVVLTIGESTTTDAIRAVEAQTLPAREIVVVENVTPFHRALNEGASRVRTPFFVQIDADMIPDPICFEALRRVVIPSAGLVSGFLRDRLLGRICCIKLFRTECFHQCSVPDSVASDSDFLDALYKLGWQALMPVRFDGERHQWHTFAEHRREYSPHYTFNKFMIEGCRARYRKDSLAVRERLTRLHQRPQDVTVFAQVGLVHGIFLEERGDLHRPLTENAEWRWLDGFLQAGGHGAIGRAGTLCVDGEIKEILRTAYRCGIELRRARDAAAFRAAMHALGESRSALAWVAQVGLGHGLFATDFDEDRFEDRFRLFSELLRQSEPRYKPLR